MCIRDRKQEDQQTWRALRVRTYLRLFGVQGSTLRSVPCSPLFVPFKSRERSVNATFSAQQMTYQLTQMKTPVEPLGPRHHQCQRQRQGRRRTKLLRDMRIVSYNGNCWATAEGFIHETAALVVLIQKHKLGAERQLDVSRRMAAAGWHSITDKGQYAGGTCIAARSYLDVWSGPSGAT
eukprot:6567709-Pyramimonas_sp.AAC.1